MIISRTWHPCWNWHPFVLFLQLIIIQKWYILLHVNYTSINIPGEKPHVPPTLYWDFCKFPQTSQTFQPSSMLCVLLRNSRLTFMTWVRFFLFWDAFQVCKFPPVVLSYLVLSALPVFLLGCVRSLSLCLYYMRDSKSTKAWISSHLSCVPITSLSSRYWVTYNLLKAR